jgi:hydroxymethylpyrimidine kinase/phosphomethylpyrimidine kinase/thiamine-phosphate diphosphorylase
VNTSTPIIWSIAGLDTAGGAGLSADQRAADAMGVHLCPITAALTAQHSRGVDAVFPVAPTALQAQLKALAQDLPPKAIKTGLLGSVQAIEQVAYWVDHWRAQCPSGRDPHQHMALIVDPVLGATAGGAAFASDDIIQAYRTHLLPRATVLTPNRAEAKRLLHQAGRHDGPDADIPSLAGALQELGVRSVVITGGDARGHSRATANFSLDWIQTPHAQGWLTAPRIQTTHTHGTGCTFASGVAAACALGHVEADAMVLAKMLTHHALMQARAAGQGAGPVLASRSFTAGPPTGGAPLPWLGLGQDLPWQMLHAPHPTRGPVRHPLFKPFQAPQDGLYGILSDGDQVTAALQAGLRCVQLRHKQREGLGPHLEQSILAARNVQAQLFINDHWQDALATLQNHHRPSRTGPTAPIGLHLGQEDLLTLTPAQQDQLLAHRDHIMLGLSSHSLWELARAAGCGASLIACGPVQPTTTKDMPWLAQGPGNLAWWIRHSPAPVVAIGGLLTPGDVGRFAAMKPAALCVVRGLGQTLSEMQQAIPPLRQAALSGGAQPSHTPPCLPHPVLPPSMI